MHYSQKQKTKQANKQRNTQTNKIGFNTNFYEQ